MKIAMFTECYKPILNGVVNSLDGTKKGLEELGNTVYVFAPTYKNYQDKPEDKNIIHLKSYEIPNGKGYQYIFNPNKAQENIIKNVDIIHIHHPFIIGKIALNLSKKFNIPVVFTFHTRYDLYTHYLPLPENLSKNIIINYIKKFTEKLDLVIATGEGIKQNAKKIFNISTTIKIVNNSINIDKFSKNIPIAIKNEILNNLQIDLNNQILIYTGRIAKEKNLDFLIKAFKKINEKIPETTLLFAGGGPEIEYYKKMAIEMKLKNNIKFTNVVKYEDMPIYVSLGKIFVMSSITDTYPLTILEAMARGIPAVIMQAPGTADVVEDNIDGLISKKNPTDFCNKVIKLINNSNLYKKLSDNARKKAKWHSQKSRAKEMLKVYEEAISIHKEKEAILD